MGKYVPDQATMLMMESLDGISRKNEIVCGRLIMHVHRTRISWTSSKGNKLPSGRSCCSSYHAKLVTEVATYLPLRMKVLFWAARMSRCGNLELLLGLSIIGCAASAVSRVSHPCSPPN